MNASAALSGFRFRDDPGIELGIDGHLLAGHRIQGKSSRNLGNAAGALGYDDEIDYHQDQENNRPDHVISPDHEYAKSIDHRTGVSIEQDQSSRRYVKTQAVKRDRKQQGWKN